MKRYLLTGVLLACSLAPATPPGPPLWIIVAGESCEWCTFRYQLDMQGCEYTRDMDPDDNSCEQTRAWAYSQWLSCMTACTNYDPTDIMELWMGGYLTTDQMIASIVTLEEERARIMPIHRSRRVWAGSAG